MPARAVTRFFRRLGLPFGLAFGIAAAHWLGAVESADHLLSAARFRAVDRAPTGEVVLVDIDARSLAEIGVWPWPRRLHAQLTDMADGLGASQLAFDVDFSSSGASPEDDRIFAEALSRSSMPVFLAAFMQRATAASDELHVNMPVEELLARSWPAMVNVPLDSDGNVRRFPLASGSEEQVASMPAVLAGRDGIEGEFGIDYSINAYALPRVSYVDLLRGRIDPGMISGKSLIVGASAIELNDLMSVPVYGVVSGPTVIALATETLLQGRDLTLLEGRPLATVVIVLLGALVLSRLRTVPAGLVLAGAALSTEGVALYLQTGHQLSVPTAGAQLAFVALLGWTFLREFDLRRILLWVARAEATNRQSILERVVEDGFDGILLVGEDEEITRVNRTACEILAASEPKSLDDLPPGMRTTVRDCLAAPQEEARPAAETGLERITLADGTRRIIEYAAARVIVTDTASALDGPPRETAIACLTLRDVTERETAQERMRFLALHDSLTGLHNRRALEIRLEQDHRDVALLSFDLDRFKTVNDTVGHSVGDRVLKEAARRAVLALGERAFVARLGGDEFFAIVAAAEAEEKALCLAAAIRQPFRIEGHTISIGVSVGISMAGETAGELMRQADLALYRAKRTGAPARFDPAMEEDRRSRLELERELGSALERGEFRLVYQPQVSLDTGLVTGAEALLRWNHPARGSVSPMAFVPIAEEMGLIHRIGAWALEEACREAKRWPLPIRIAVNVSPVQFGAGDLVSAVEQALVRSGLPPERLELEITESLFVQESTQLPGIFDRLMELGTSFALDDFGTGYSSLGYLQRFPVSKVKIDRSFIRDLTVNPAALAILRSVKVLAAGLRIRTIAEGIETEEQARLLRELGYDDGQGYLFSKPLPPDQFGLLLDNSSAPAAASSAA